MVGSREEEPSGEEGTSEYDDEYLEEDTEEVYADKGISHFFKGSPSSQINLPLSVSTEDELFYKKKIPTEFNTQAIFFSYSQCNFESVFFLYKNVYTTLANFSFFFTKAFCF